ncbi:MAG: helix-turn-helix domain-containing protein [Nitriliruptor sp.]
MSGDPRDRGAAVGPVLTVAEVADTLRVSSMTVYRLVKAGELPALRVGKNIRIRTEDLDAYLAAGAVTHDQSNG